MWQYFPNIEEVTINTLSTTATEMILEPFINMDGNIAAKELFRDIAKIPGTVFLMYNNVDYGGTGYKYDFANVASQFVKTACKASLIGGSYYFSGQGLAKTVAPWANIICEMPSRTMVEVGRLHQKENDTTTPFFEYYLGHINSTIAIGAISSSFAKKGVASVAGVALEKYIPSYKMARLYAITIDEILVGEYVGNYKDTYWNIAKTMYTKLDQQTFPIKTAVLSLATLTEFCFREISNVFNSYSLTFVARVAQEEGAEFAENLFAHFTEGLFTYPHIDPIELVGNEL